MKTKHSFFLAASLVVALTTGVANADPITGRPADPSRNTCSASAKCKDGSTVTCNGSGSVNAQCWGVDGEGAFCISNSVGRNGTLEESNSSVPCPSGFPNS